MVSGKLANIAALAPGAWIAGSSILGVATWEDFVDGVEENVH